MSNRLPDAFSLRPNRTLTGWRVDFCGGSVHAEGPFALQDALAAAVAKVAEGHVAARESTPDARKGKGGGR